MEESFRLTPRSVAEILSSLEPEAILRSVQRACGQILGPCEVRLFTLPDHDGPGLVPFGVEPDPTVRPEVGGPEPGQTPGAASRSMVDGKEAWRVPLPLLEGDARSGGVLQGVFDEPLGPARLALLDEVCHVVAVAVRNARVFAKTRRLTFTDDLTALYNSRFMALYLDRELKRCRRTKSSLSLLFMDLDGFKNINDTHGHLAGSRTLVEVGAVLEKTVRDADILIRYGGDEFVILFPETPLPGGLVIAEKIRQVIGNTKFLESQNIEARVSASIGIAAYPESADDVRGLISSADRAMYRAKTLGKDRVVVANPLVALPNSPKEA